MMMMKVIMKMKKMKIQLMKLMKNSVMMKVFQRREKN